MIVSGAIQGISIDDRRLHRAACIRAHRVIDGGLPTF